jgi:hypothetical protein
LNSLIHHLNNATFDSFWSFSEANAALTGEVMLATFVRFFAQKVPILLNPFERLVISFCCLFTFYEVQS